MIIRMNRTVDQFFKGLGLGKRNLTQIYVVLDHATLWGFNSYKGNAQMLYLVKFVQHRDRPILLMLQNCDLKGRKYCC